MHAERPGGEPAVRLVGETEARPSSTTVVSPVDERGAPGGTPDAGQRGSSDGLILKDSSGTRTHIWPSGPTRAVARR